jgi:hypothetical protein
MQIRRLLVLTILGLSLTAAADFRTITEVHEVNLIFLRLPATSSGTLSFAGCADCDSQTIRVIPATPVASVTNREDTVINVSHHLESNTVTKVTAKL